MLELTKSELLDIKIEAFKRRLFDFITIREVDGLEKKHTKQEQALEILTDEETEEFMYGGAAGGAKSWTGCSWLAFACLAYPRTKWFIGRKELKRITESTLITFFKVAREYDFLHRFKFNAQKNFILFDNGSRIDLLDLKTLPSDPMFERFGSTEYTGGWIEEAPECAFGAFEVLKTRIGRHLNDYYSITAKIFLTANPNKNWSKKEFYDKHIKGSIGRIRKFLQALVTENPFIEKGYIERLRRTKDNVKRERLLSGNWNYADDASSIIDYDSIQDYWNPSNIERTGERFLTIDVARKGKDKTVYRVWDGWLCILRISKNKSKVNEIVDDAKELQRKYKIPNSRTVADEDGVGGGVVDFLNCKGFVNNSRPIKQRISEEYLVPNYDNLKSQCSIEMAKKICDKEVGEICNDIEIIELVSEEMEQVKYKDIDKEGKIGILPKDKIKEFIARSPDDWDSIMMRYYFHLIPKRKKSFGSAKRSH